MSLCKVSILLAYISLVYIICSIYYLIVTQKYGTPFNDALENYPELKKIKMKSAEQRRNTFYQGILLSIILMIFIKPFKKC